jgi:Arc/MetJ family transcription regulator
MLTNIDIDEELLEEAKQVGAHRSKREAVNSALTEYVQRHRQQRILELFGTIDFDPAYDHKAERLKTRPA